MTTFTIKVPESAENKLSQFVKELGGEIISSAPNKKKEKLLKEIQEGLKEVKAIREGKMKPLTLSDIFKSE